MLKDLMAKDIICQKVLSKVITPSLIEKTFMNNPLILI